MQAVMRQHILWFMTLLKDYVCLIKEKDLLILTGLNMVSTWLLEIDRADHTPYQPI